VKRTTTTTTVTRSERYIINGKEYGSLEEIPEAERKLLDEPVNVLGEPFNKLLEDKDKDGIPDILQGSGTGTASRRTESKVVTVSSDARAGATDWGKTLPYAIILALLGAIAYLLLER